ncbi:MAG: hypothetical protein RIQ56_123 [Candidatus Parcubacteria bacterium]|jgi:uncharacterized membrane protein
MQHKHHTVVVPPRHAKLTRENLTESFHSNIHIQRDWTDDLAEFLTHKFGTISFLILNFGLFVVWIAANTGLFGSFTFDPFPFGFLTMAVSLEAIFLSIVVLISQNRQSRIADIRQQMDFEIDVRSEEEITKILAILDELRKAAGIKKADPELEKMKTSLNLEEIQKKAEEIKN